AQRNIRRFVDALLVRAAVNKRTDGVSNTTRTHTMEPMRKTSDAAQGLSPLKQNRRTRNSGRKASPNAKQLKTGEIDFRSRGRIIAYLFTCVEQKANPPGQVRRKRATKSRERGYGIRCIV